MTKRRVAILDGAGRLRDCRTIVSSNEIAGSSFMVDVDPGDLPLDGSYLWDERRRAFVPGPKLRPQHGHDDALYELARLVLALVDDSWASRSQKELVPSMLRAWVDDEKKRRGDA